MSKKEKEKKAYLQAKNNIYSISTHWYIHCSYEIFFSSWAHIFTATEKKIIIIIIMWKGEKKYLKTIFHPIYSLMFFSTIKNTKTKQKLNHLQIFQGVMGWDGKKEDEKLYWKASNNQHEQNP